ncbi:hypothetical protein JNB_05854 [Janibacter sp. HTCC2649]|nr:hypothetical protein JNB_05854 [Janibacter sp. HTCC2649]
MGQSNDRAEGVAPPEGEGYAVEHGEQ